MHGVKELPGIELCPAPGCEWAQLEDDLRAQLLQLAARKEVREAHARMSRVQARCAKMT
jgi:hypothetical protein